jgi:hypothetical protein
MGRANPPVLDTAPKQFPNKHNDARDSNDARLGANQRTDSHKYSVRELWTPHWRRLEKHSNDLRRKWTSVFAGCIHRRVSAIWGEEHVLSRVLDGNADSPNNRSTKNMECVTSKLLCIVLRFALDASRVEQALTAFLAKSHAFGKNHILYESCNSSYESSKQLLHAWFINVIHTLDSIQSRVNIEVHDNCISITDCFKIQLTAKEDIDALDAVRKSWRVCFDSGDEKGVTLTGFKAHDEALRVVRRVPFIRCFFTLMQSHDVSLKSAQKAYCLHMHAQLFYMAQQCKCAPLLFLAERTTYGHIEEPYPCVSVVDSAREKHLFAADWLTRRDRVQELYAIHAPTLATILLSKRIATGRIVVTHANVTFHESIASLLQRASTGKLASPDPQSCATHLMFQETTFRIYPVEIVFAVLSVIHDAYQIMQTETNVSKRWCNACVPHVVLCSAMTLLLGASEHAKSLDVWNAMLDVCVLNGADKEDVFATIPFFSPFDLPDTVVASDETLAEKMTHILSVVALLQRFPHAFELSLTTWLFVSMCTMSGVGLEPMFLHSAYLTDAINAFLLFEPNDAYTSLAHRVLHRLSTTNAHDMASVSPTDIVYDPTIVVQRAMQTGELAHAALVHAFLQKKQAHPVVTMMFSSLDVSAVDILASWRRYFDARLCVVFETESTVFWTLGMDSLEAYRASTGAQSPLVHVWRSATTLLESARHALVALEMYDTLWSIVLNERV